MAHNAGGAPSGVRRLGASADAAANSATVGRTLLAALRPDGHVGRWTIDQLDPAFLPALYSAARDHQVLPLIHHAVGKAAHTGSSARLEDPLDGTILATVARNLRATSDLAALAELLDTLDVPWVTVKGPVLAELAYPTPAVRPYVDLDVLVHPHAFSTTVAALEAWGATLLDKNWSLQLRKRRAQASLLLPFGTVLDLHWHLVNEARIRDAFVWQMGPSLECRRSVTVGGACVPTLDAVDSLMHVALHAALSGGHHLLWAKDIERLASVGDVDWDEFVRRTCARRLTLPVGVMLRRARRLLGADVPDATLRQLGSPRTASLAYVAIERLATPTSIARGRRTGRFALSAARTGATSSAYAVLAGQLQRLERRPTPERGRSDHPLQRTDGDPAARAQYLSLVAKEG